jgi:predicted nucleic acid-binding Zn ribbon protein
MEKVSDIVGDILGALGMEKRVYEYRVVTEWKEIVGEVIAGRVIPVGIDRGRLILKVKSSSWMMEMRMMGEEIKRRVCSHIGSEVVQEIRFVRD